MAFKFGTRSERNLIGVHPDLAKVMRAAIQSSPVDFAVVEGKRTAQRQRMLLDAGASRTLHSRHLTGHAVDIVPYVGGKMRWDWPLYRRLAAHIKTIAKASGVKIEWGGDWRTFKDGPHFQLPRSKYA